MQIVSWSLSYVTSTMSHWFLMLGYSGRPSGTLSHVVKYGIGFTSVEAPMWRASLAHISFGLVKFMFSQTCTIPLSECSSCQLVQWVPCGANDGQWAGTQLQTRTWTCSLPTAKWFCGKDWGCNTDWSIGTFHCHEGGLGIPVCNYLKQRLMYKGQIEMDV